MQLWTLLDSASPVAELSDSTYSACMQSSANGKGNIENGEEKNFADMQCKMKRSFVVSETNFINQFLPRIPRTIDKVVRYWRYGCIESNGIPVKNFGFVKFRKENIDNYNDKKLRKGRRQLYVRHRALVQIAANCIDPLISFMDSDNQSDDIWNSAVPVIHHHT